MIAQNSRMRAEHTHIHWSTGNISTTLLTQKELNCLLNNSHAQALDKVNSPRVHNTSLKKCSIANGPLSAQPKCPDRGK